MTTVASTQRDAGLKCWDGQGLDVMADGLDVGIIGTGRVGRALALALNQKTGCGFTAWNRSADALRSFQTLLPQLEVASSPEAVAERAELILLTVSDDGLADTVERISKARIEWPSRTVAHFSGRSSADVLRPFHEQGACVIAFHPAMAFAGDAKDDVKRLETTKFAVTALTDEAERKGEALVRLLGGSPFIVRNEDRVLYHAALTHASNHLVTLVVQARELLDQLNIEGGAEIIRPLLEAALANSLAKGAAGATGPVVRGDAETIHKQVTALADHSPDLLASYCAMTLAGIAIAERAERITPAKAEELKAALEGEVL